MRLFTYTLSSGSLQINDTDGVLSLTIKANSSSACQILGNIIFKGLNSSTNLIENGNSVTLTTTANSPLDGITITWVSGTVDILISI